jgi:cytosine/adenosine deaminase-related metal-dependent hydrolase
LLDAGCAVGIGTDSSASNHDLDLLAEVRELSRLEPALDASALLRMATLDGARCLGLEDRGALASGLRADLAAFRLPGTRAPSEDLVRHGGRRTVEAVMSGGEWRVLDGDPLGIPDTRVTAAAGLATERARVAVESLGA